MTRRFLHETIDPTLLRLEELERRAHFARTADTIPTFDPCVPEFVESDPVVLADGSGEIRLPRAKRATAPTVKIRVPTDQEISADWHAQLSVRR